MPRLVSEETRRKMSESAKNRVRTDAELAQIRSIRPPVTDATRKKQSDALKGKPLTSEHRTKLSEAKKGKKLAPEVYAAQAATRTGRAMAEETKAKVSVARKGIVFSEETRQRMSEAKRRQWEDPEYREKTIAARVAYYATHPLPFKDKKVSKNERVFMQELDDAGIRYLYEAIRIPYVDDTGRLRTYLPDFYLPDHNIIVEIKATHYWYKKNPGLVEAKLKAAQDAGFEVVMVLDYRTVYWNGWLRRDRHA